MVEEDVLISYHINLGVARHVNMYHVPLKTMKASYQVNNSNPQYKFHCHELLVLKGNVYNLYRCTTQRVIKSISLDMQAIHII
jgi:hypothetical protein